MLLKTSSPNTKRHQTRKKKVEKSQEIHHSLSFNIMTDEITEHIIYIEETTSAYKLFARSVLMLTY
jgi:hypothetical protein